MRPVALELDSVLSVEAFVGADDHLCLLMRMRNGDAELMTDDDLIWLIGAWWQFKHNPITRANFMRWRPRSNP